MTGAGDSGHPHECHWCGAVLGPDAVRLAGRTVCSACGVATTDPFPSPEELARAYGDWYRPTSARRFAGTGDRLLARSRGALARRVDRAAPPGRVLDVGAGSGWLVDALAGRGRSVLGLEREGHRADLSQASIAELDGEWAAIVFWHSLEHLAAPGAAIEAAAGLLAPDGLLVVAVPNNASLQAQVFGERWLHLDLPRHLVHLTEPALRLRLEGFGLSVERVSRVRAGQVVIGWLDGLVGSVPANLSLYEALRSPAARSAPMSSGRRAVSLAAGVALLPVAAGCAAAEVAIGRSGTTYIEARAPAAPRAQAPRSRPLCGSRAGETACRAVPGPTPAGRSARQPWVWGP